MRTLYLPTGGRWYRARLPTAPGDPTLLAEVVDTLQSPRPAGQAGGTVPAGTPVATGQDPNGLTCVELPPTEVRALLRSTAWTPAGPVVLGAHASLLLDFARATARWLVVLGNPEQVERMRPGSPARLAVAGPEPAWRAPIDRDVLSTSRHALAFVVPKLVGASGAPAQPADGSEEVDSLAAVSPRKADAVTRRARGAAAAERLRAPLRTPTVVVADAPGAAGVGLWLRSWAEAVRAGRDREVPSAPAAVATVAGTVQSQLFAPPAAGGSGRAPSAGAPAPAALRAASPAATVQLCAWAARLLVQAEDRGGLMATWCTLVVVAPDGTMARVPVPLGPAASRVPDQIAPYTAVELFGDSSASGQRLALFRLNKALRDALVDTMPPGLSEDRQEAWLAQVPIPQLRSQLDPEALARSVPAGGAVAFTPFGEAWLLPDAPAARAFVAAAEKRRAAIPNVDTTWSEVAATDNGSMWVPVLTRAQLSSRPARTPGGTARASTLQPSLIERYVAQAASSAVRRQQGLFAQSTVPECALPYLRDSQVRRQAFARAAAGDRFDWVTSHSLIGYAFRDESAEKVLLPAGTVVYKFNDFDSLIPPLGAPGDKRPAAAVYAHMRGFDRTSPWWSPWSDFGHSGGWAQRVQFARAMGQFRSAKEVKAKARQLLNREDLSEREAQAIADSFRQWGALLEVARLTSVVKENWNSLRYIVAIELVQPIFAFFGGFGSLPRIDMVPASVDLSAWPPPPVERRSRTAAQLTVSKAGGASWSGGDKVNVGQIERVSKGGKKGWTVGEQRMDTANTELPGGATQLYIPGLRWFHPLHAPGGNYRLYSLDDPALASLAVAGRYPPIDVDTDLPPFQILDLARDQSSPPPRSP